MSNHAELQNSLALFSQQAHQRGSAKDIATRSLAVALLQLMQHQPFDSIGITQLTQTAGVSRMTYYRHYQHKQQILTDYLAQIDSDLPFIDLSHAQAHSVYDFLVQLFQRLIDFELSSQILLRQGFEHLILAAFNQSRFFCSLTTIKDTEERVYRRLFASGMLANTYLHWTKTGQQASPKQLATWLMAAGWHSLVQEVGALNRRESP